MSDTLTDEDKMRLAIESQALTIRDLRTVNAALLEALDQYLWAEEIDDAAVRDGELAVARQAARAAIALAKVKP